jgi:hypothetical protein
MSTDYIAGGWGGGGGGLEVDATTALLMGRIAVLEELVRWLSLPFGENEPVFAGADGQGTLDGRPLGQAPQMHELWHQVTGREHVDPTVERRYFKACCGHFHIDMPDDVRSAT